MNCMYVKLGNWVTGEYRQIISGFIISWLLLFLLQLYGLVHLPCSCSELTLKESILDIHQDSLDVSFQPDSDDIVDFGILSWCSLVGEYHCFSGTYYLPWNFLIGYVILEDEATIWSQNIGHHAPNDSEISQRNGDLNSSSGSQVILRFLWKSKSRYRVIIVASILLCYINPFHYYPTICSWVFQVVSYIQVFRQKPRVHISSPPYVLHAPPNSPRFHPHSNRMRGRLINYELPILQFSPSSCYLLPSGTKYFPQRTIFKHSWTLFLPSCNRPNYTRRKRGKITCIILVSSFRFAF